jgi:hypothetical protein
MRKYKTRLVRFVAKVIFSTYVQGSMSSALEMWGGQRPGFIFVVCTFGGLEREGESE